VDITIWVPIVLLVMFLFVLTESPMVFETLPPFASFPALWLEI
jgi:hypothetical protein